MKFVTTKKKTLFDGDQEELFTNAQKLQCTCCTETILFNPRELNSCSELSKDKINLISDNIKDLKIVNFGEDIFIKFNYLPLKYGEFTCAQCGNEHIAFFGIGEFQPGRFMLIQAAIAKAL